jgi:DNA-binding Xre family transcriptional regulator
LDKSSTLEAICETLDCQPGEILEFRPEAAKKKLVAR